MAAEDRATDGSPADERPPCSICGSKSDFLLARGNDSVPACWEHVSPAVTVSEDDPEATDESAWPIAIPISERFR